MQGPVNTIDSYEDLIMALSFSDAYSLNVPYWGDSNCEDYQAYEHINHQHLYAIASYLEAGAEEVGGRQKHVDVRNAVSGNVTRFVPPEQL